MLQSLSIEEGAPVSGHVENALAMLLLSCGACGYSSLVSLRTLVLLSISSSSPFPMAAAVEVNGNASSGDWEGRYYHVDQILDKPGPRTDLESFSPGEAVRAPSMRKHAYHDVC